MEMKPRFSWITPMMKQCWVTFGVSLHMSQMGFIIGFSSVLVPQLKLPESSIPIDDNYGSWIASFPAISLTIGNLIVPSVMGNFGRRTANFITLTIFTIGWICLAVSPNVTFLLATRCLQGIGMGMVAALGPLLIGEYTSPKMRGAFLMSISLFNALGVMGSQALGYYLYWRTAAYISVGLTIVIFMILITSPESSSWLAAQGRYEECRTTFKWLRGDTEDEELEKLIASSLALRQANMDEKSSTDNFKTKLQKSMRYYGQTIKRNEFYKPFIIMVHFYAMAHWSGINLIAAYAVDILGNVMGKDADIPTMMLCCNLTRVTSSVIALVLIQTIKRRRLLFMTVGMNVLILFLLAVFTYIRKHNIYQLDAFWSYYIGSSLLYVLTFFVGIGALPLSFILAGEIFPLRFKSIAGGFSCIFFSINLFITIKTVPFFIQSIKLYGLFMLYAGLLLYFLIVALIMLPETKDKTLQEIEEEFTGKNKEKSCDAKA